MVETCVGLARYNEFHEQTGGVPGDQLQVTTPDFDGEVAFEKLPVFLARSEGAVIYRTVTPEYSARVGEGIVKACNNVYIGYDVNNRLSVLAYGVYSGKNGKGVECDNSSLSRVVIQYGTDIDLGDYYNNNVKGVFNRSGLFLDPIPLTEDTVIYIGDVIVLDNNIIGIVGYGLDRPVPKPGQGTTDYNDLENKPTINGTTVEGDKTSADYNISGGGSTPTVSGEALIFH